MVEPVTTPATTRPETIFCAVVAAATFAAAPPAAVAVAAAVPVAAALATAIPERIFAADALDSNDCENVSNVELSAHATAPKGATL